MLLDNSQMDEVWDMLQQHSEVSEFDDKRINYDDFLKVSPPPPPPPLGRKE